MDRIWRIIKIWTIIILLILSVSPFWSSREYLDINQLLKAQNEKNLVIEVDNHSLLIFKCDLNYNGLVVKEKRYNFFGIKLYTRYYISIDDKKIYGEIL